MVQNAKKVSNGTFRIGKQPNSPEILYKLNYFTKVRDFPVLRPKSMEKFDISTDPKYTTKSVNGTFVPGIFVPRIFVPENSFLENSPIF